jgi:adenosylhomocysteinase
MTNPKNTFFNELSWAKRHMPRSARTITGLPDLSALRIALSVHLDLKIVPLVEALLDRHAEIFLVTCNPATVRDQVVAYLQEKGAVAHAWKHIAPADYVQALHSALAWGPTHICEFGADLTYAYHHSPQGADHPKVQASLEGTGSGISRIENLDLLYPVINWDDLPIKEGLHNRHMVGITTWQAFFERTHLTLHDLRVAVIGYGSVGQGVAATARAYGGAVTVVELDPARALQAAYDGYHTASLEEALPVCDVIATGTGAHNVIADQHYSLLKNGTFLLNIGHRADEIDVSALLAYPHEEVLPYVEAVHLGERTVYLLAGGSMFNLTAGWGDSLNAFDITLAVMTAGIHYLVTAGSRQPPGVHLLPRSAWEPVLKPSGGSWTV